jgi:1,4-alpha-glucan branching enzyme
MIYSGGYMPKKSVKVKPKRKRIEFSFDAPDASKVFLAGDFNEWNIKKHPMKKNQNGLWQKIVMLYPGKYEYKFLVDGKWEQDPNNDWKCRNCFGTQNNIISVLPKV